MGSDIHVGVLVCDFMRRACDSLRCAASLQTRETTWKARQGAIHVLAALNEH